MHHLSSSATAQLVEGGGPYRARLKSLVYDCDFPRFVGVCVKSLPGFAQRRLPGNVRPMRGRSIALPELP